MMEHPSMAAEIGFVNSSQFIRQALLESKKKDFTVAKASSFIEKSRSKLIDSEMTGNPVGKRAFEKFNEVTEKNKELGEVINFCGAKLKQIAWKWPFIAMHRVHQWMWNACFLY